MPYISTAERLGMERGMERGMELGIEKTALGMLEAGFDRDVVAKITVLSREKIDSLLKPKEACDLKVSA